MKKILFVLVLALLFTQYSIVYSADNALPSEKLCGLWEGDYFFPPGIGLYGNPSKMLITPSLSGLFYWHNSSFDGSELIKFQISISENQLVFVDLEKPEKIRIKGNLSEINKLKGECTFIHSQGSFSNFTKVRDLTIEEKQLPLSELEGLVTK
jgi:hypothetical protein